MPGVVRVSWNQSHRRAADAAIAGGAKRDGHGMGEELLGSNSSVSCVMVLAACAVRGRLEPSRVLGVGLRQERVAGIGAAGGVQVQAKGAGVGGL